MTESSTPAERAAAIEKLINAGEEIQVLIADLSGQVWDHRPMLDECERPIEAASNGVDRLVDYLEDQKKAALAEEASHGDG